jgi:hypothetical protein
MKINFLSNSLFQTYAPYIPIVSIINAIHCIFRPKNQILFLKKNEDTCKKIRAVTIGISWLPIIGNIAAIILLGKYRKQNSTVTPQNS